MSRLFIFQILRYTGWFGFNLEGFNKPAEIVLNGKKVWHFRDYVRYTNTFKITVGYSQSYF